MGNMKVEVFKGKTATVNSYLFSDEQSAILVDALRSAEDSEKLVQDLVEKQLNLTHILITHGHPDHYGGVPLVKKAYPDAQIVVASKEIKEDIIGMTNWMLGEGWLDNLPHLLPVSNGQGFDYEGEIGILDEEILTMAGGSQLAIKSDYKPMEASHMTTIYAPDINAFFTSDFVYNKVHPWLGVGVEPENIVNWKEQLLFFKEQFKEVNLTFYPGHGEPGTIEIFDKILNYILTFEKVIFNSSSEQEAMDAMIEKYPEWTEADFLLANSVSYQFSKK